MLSIRSAYGLVFALVHLANGKLLFDELGGKREDLVQHVGALPPLALHAQVCLSVLCCVLSCVRMSVSRSAFGHAVSRNSSSHALSLLPLLIVHLVPRSDPSSSLQTFHLF